MALSDYRPVRGKKGYAPWVAETAGAHGVYVIRQRARAGEPAIVLYVGESHTHRLRETLQRHFQQWTGKTAGPTFDASTTEVAIETFLEGNDAIRRQNRLIRSLRPTHNVVEPDEETGAEATSEEDTAFDELMDYFEGLGT